MDKQNKIISNLRALMERNDVTVRGLAAQTGISDKTIMRARGEMIEACTLKTLSTIAQALGVKTKDLYEEE